MPSPSKAKGNAYERELVARAKELGLTAKRAWGSDGRSMGMAEDVDLVVEGQKIQAKRRACLPDYIKPAPGIDAQVLREDRGTSYVVIGWEDYLEFLVLLTAKLKTDKGA